MRYILPLLALLPLAACAAADGQYPSLLPRQIESRGDAEPVRPDPVAVPDTTLDAAIAAKQALAAAAAKRFQSAAITAEARVAVARGVAVGNPSWVAAQTALADLSPIRNETVELAAALEELAIARAQEGKPAYPALDAAIAEVGGLAQAQGDRIAALESALAG
jgi:hypothetical protein